VFTGGCRCGAVRYTLSVGTGAAEKLPGTYACHCTICQRASGSSFAHQMPVFEAGLSVEGEVLERAHVTPSGARSIVRYCPECLTRLYNTNDSRPGLAILRAGTLDGSEHLSPRFHIFVSTKQPWIALPEGIPAFEEAAPVEVFARLLA
jgi:hypothetical protein